MKTMILATMIMIVMSFTIDKKDVYTIMIDAGHGGKDNGVVVDNTLIEKDLNLSLAKLLKTKSSSMTDFKLVFTRENDEYISLDERIEKSKMVSADLFLSLHINSVSDHGKSGIECYISGDSDTKQKSEIIGKVFMDELSHLKGIKTEDKIKEADFKVLKGTSCPSILLNLGNMANKGDLNYLTDKKNQGLICDKILSAIKNIKK